MLLDSFIPKYINYLEILDKEREKQLILILKEFGETNNCISVKIYFFF